MVETVAGVPRGPGSTDGPALSASFASSGPSGLAFFNNNLFIADSSETLRHGHGTFRVGQLDEVFLLMEARNIPSYRIPNNGTLSYLPSSLSSPQ